MLSPGQHLRIVREQLGLTMRDVEMASATISAKHGNDDFAIPLSRLSDIETKGIVPSIFRLYSLAVIYRRDLRDILAWYGIDVNACVGDLSVAEPRHSHRSEVLHSATVVRMPKHTQEAEVIGQVIGVAMRLVDWHVTDSVPEPKARAALN